MATECEHPLCAIIGGPCSLATRRSRGCRPNVTAKEVAAGVLDEVRALLPAVAANDRGAAIRLAAIVRREALEDRNLLATISSEEPELAPALLHLCRRQS